MDRQACLDNLKSKISDAKKRFSHIKKYAYFDKYNSFILEYLTEWSENAQVLQLLACHPEKNVRKSLVHNPYTSYETLLYLLTDNKVDVVRHVLSYGNLQQEDFYVLSEQFKTSSFKKIEDASEYLQLIKPASTRHWVHSQSICLLHNHFVDMKAMHTINIIDFAPFSSEGDLNTLLKVKEKRMQEIKGNVHVSKRIAPTDCMNIVQLWSYNKYKVKEWRTKNSNYESVFSEAEGHLLKYVSEAESNVTSTFSSDKKLARSHKISTTELKRLLCSNDTRMLRIALQNPSISLSDIEDNIWSHGDILIKNKSFFKHLLKKPSMVRDLELKEIRKLLMTNENFSPAIINVIINMFKREVYKNVLKWADIILLIIKQKNVTSNNVKKLYDYAFTNNTNISEKRSIVIEAIEHHPKFK